MSERNHMEGFSHGLRNETEINSNCQRKEKAFQAQSPGAEKPSLRFECELLKVKTGEG